MQRSSQQHGGGWQEPGLPDAAGGTWNQRDKDVLPMFVPTKRDVEALMTPGVCRGRIWTAKELAELLALPDRAPQIVRTLAQVKLTVDGEIVETRSRGKGDRGQEAQSA